MDVVCVSGDLPTVSCPHGEVYLLGNDNAENRRDKGMACSVNVDGSEMSEASPRSHTATFRGVNRGG